MVVISPVIGMWKEYRGAHDSLKKIQNEPYHSYRPDDGICLNKFSTKSKKKDQKKVFIVLNGMTGAGKEIPGLRILVPPGMD